MAFFLMSTDGRAAMDTLLLSWPADCDARRLGTARNTRVVRTSSKSSTRANSSLNLPILTYLFNKWNLVDQFLCWMFVSFVFYKYFCQFGTMQKSSLGEAFSNFHWRNLSTPFRRLAKSDFWMVSLI